MVNSHWSVVPTPDRTTLDDIVRAARDILEAEGLPRLTMQAVAERVGVRAPSLYKRVAGRDALIGLTADATAADLADRLETVDGGLVALAHAFRQFALGHPEGYSLLFAIGPEPTRPLAATLERVTAPVLRECERLVGGGRALDAARTLTAWITGFVGMELAGAFRLGGDIGQAFDYGIDRLHAAFAAS